MSYGRITTTPRRGVATAFSIASERCGARVPCRVSHLRGNSITTHFADRLSRYFQRSGLTDVKEPVKGVFDCTRSALRYSIQSSRCGAPFTSNGGSNRALTCTCTYLYRQELKYMQTRIQSTCRLQVLKAPRPRQCASPSKFARRPPRCSRHNYMTQASLRMPYRHHLPSAAGPSSGRKMGQPHPQTPPPPALAV